MGWDEFRAVLQAEQEILAELKHLGGESPPAGVRAALESLALHNADLNADLARYEAGLWPIKLAVVGDFNAGKSSFISHFLEYPGLCPENPWPTTSVVTTFCYGPREQILFRQEDGRHQEIDRSGYIDLVCRPSVNPSSGYAASFTYQLPHPKLHGVELIDTPGFNNPDNPSDTIITNGVMKEVDACFFLLQSEFGSIGCSGIKRVCRIREDAPDAPIHLILSQADRKSPEDITRIKREIARDYNYLFASRILAYSTRGSRSDYDDREAMAGLLQDLRSDKDRLIQLAVRRRVQAFQEHRQSVVPWLMVQFEDLHEELREIEAKRLACLQRVMARVEKGLMETWDPFLLEVHQAMISVLRCEEIKGSGFFRDNARIYFEGSIFHSKVNQFACFKMANSLVIEAILSLFKEEKALQISRAEHVFQQALQSAVVESDLWVEEMWREDLTIIFPTSAKARKYVETKVSQRAQALKIPWESHVGRLRLLTDVIKHDFLNHSQEVSITRQVRLEGTLERWQRILDANPEASDNVSHPRGHP
jgi:hypothetical protein